MVEQLVRLKAAQVGLEFNDPSRQKKRDIQNIFERADRKNLWWIGGTEGGRADSQEYLHQFSDKHNFRLFISHSLWLAVNREVIVPHSWDQHWMPVVESSEGEGQHADLGIASVHWKHEDLGFMSVGETHWLTQGRTPKQSKNGINYRLNGRLVEASSDWGRKHGKGGKLAWLQGDLNTLVKDDPFRGGPWVIASDETGKHENTGHGEIDVIARYKHDTRSRAISWQVFNDREFPLFVDHFYCEVVYEVKPQKVSR